MPNPSSTRMYLLAIFSNAIRQYSPEKCENLILHLPSHRGENVHQQPGPQPTGHLLPLRMHFRMSLLTLTLELLNHHKPLKRHCLSGTPMGIVSILRTSQFRLADLAQQRPCIHPVPQFIRQDQHRRRRTQRPRPRLLPPLGLVPPG
jgi:hypothetical protein